MRHYINYTAVGTIYKYTTIIDPFPLIHKLSLVETKENTGDVKSGVSVY